jgi:hypothetical protein
MERTMYLIPTATIAAAGTYLGAEARLPRSIQALAIQSTFAYGAGGTSVKVYVQTSIDAGVSWVDVACQTFTTTAAKKVSAVRQAVALAASYTPTDGALGDDSIKDGLVGDRVRVKYVVTGTYTGVSTLSVTAVTSMASEG